MLESINGLIDFGQKSLAIAAAAIAFNPIFWNTVARQEYHNKSLTSLFRGNSLYGCYFLAVIIFSLGLFRDYLYEQALRAQPVLPILQNAPFQYAAYALMACGNTLVVSSMYALGLTGTYLGDYFGILMEAPVTGFPFNIMSAPMYYGSTMSFLGTAIFYARPAGLLLTLEVFLVYLAALTFEDPFTREIYAKRDRERTRQGKSGPEKDGQGGRNGERWRGENEENDGGIRLRDGKVLTDGKKDT